jgi:proline iminopeptidase
MPLERTHAWQWVYPPLQCYAQGWLDVGDGHEIHWEACGNPLGTPALFVHGGPGAGCVSGDRRWFDPHHYRIVLFDQRGAGRSRAQDILRANTTAHLVADIERLRKHVGIERWLLFGGSWGATLSLAYAQAHRDRVLGLVLRGVFTAAIEERRWLYTDKGVARVCPAGWQRLTSLLPLSDRRAPLEALAERLHCGDAEAEHAAARAWLRWEQDLMDFELDEVPPASPVMDASVALAAARIGVHFARHRFFLDDGQLLRHAMRLRDVPGVIVQGERDLVTLPSAAAALHQAWPGSQLVKVPGAGHASSHGSMAQRLVESTDSFRRLATTSMETSDE